MNVSSVQVHQLLLTPHQPPISEGQYNECEQCSGPPAPVDTTSTPHPWRTIQWMWAVFRSTSSCWHHINPPSVKDNTMNVSSVQVHQLLLTPHQPPIREGQYNECEQCSGPPAPVDTTSTPHQWRTIQWMWAVFRSTSSCWHHINPPSVKDNTMNVSSVQVHQLLLTPHQPPIREGQYNECEQCSGPPAPVDTTSTPHPWRTIQWMWAVFRSTSSCWHHINPPSVKDNTMNVSSVQVHQLLLTPHQPPISEGQYNECEQCSGPPAPVDTTSTPHPWRTIQWMWAVFRSTSSCWHHINPPSVKDNTMNVSSVQVCQLLSTPRQHRFSEGQYNDCLGAVFRSANPPVNE